MVVKIVTGGTPAKMRGERHTDQAGERSRGNDHSRKGRMSSAGRAIAGRQIALRLTGLIGSTPSKS